MCHAAIVGDITPCDGVCKEEKNRLETEAILEIKKMLGSDTWAGEFLFECWFSNRSHDFLYRLITGTVMSVWHLLLDSRDSRVDTIKPARI